MDLKEVGCALISTTVLPLNSTGKTDLYTVPAGSTFVPVFAVLRAGDDCGASVITLGLSTQLDDFLDFQDLSNLDADGDMAILRPSTPDEVDSSGDKAVVEVLKTYATGEIFSADVVTANGGASNNLDLFGYLVT